MPSAPKPRRHVFVCANRRVSSPLGPGCGDGGDALYDALKSEVAARGCVADVWITKTNCLGICPKEGVTVATYPSDVPIRTATVKDAAAIVSEKMDAPGWSEIDRLLESLEHLHAQRVFDLARRLNPNVTQEDIQNPHDFPELEDRDWQYADGVLTGIRTATTALRALRKRD